MSVISVFFRNYEYVNVTNSVHLLLSRFCFIVIHILEGNFIELVAWITKILRLDQSKFGISCIQFASFVLLLMKVTLKIKTKFIRQYAIPLKSVSWKKLLITALHMFCMIEHPSSKTCLFHGRETSGNFVQANAVSEIFFVFFKKMNTCINDIF